MGWGAGPAFSDGRRIILSSYEEGKVWEGQVRSYLWIYDLFGERLTEIATIDPPAAFMPCCALLTGEERMVTGPIIDEDSCICTMNLDGSEQVALTRPGEGYHSFFRRVDLADGERVTVVGDVRQLFSRRRSDTLSAGSGGRAPRIVGDERRW